MSRDLRLHEDAERELDDGADYYNLESAGLGSSFVDEIESGFARIRRHPDASREVARGVRALVLARFPYSIIYEPRRDEVLVLAIAHQRKRPHYWRGRR